MPEPDICQRQLNVDEKGVLAGKDGRLGCAWVYGPEPYLAYHDQEWGRPVPHRDQHALPRLLRLNTGRTEELGDRGLPLETETTQNTEHRTQGTNMDVERRWV